MRTRCAPMTVVEPIGFSELTDRIAAALAWIAPRERLAFPDLFEPYLEQLASTTWFGHRVAMDFMLYAPRAIVSGAEADTPERHEDHDVARSAGLWIAIGAVLDKHEYFLCVDRASAYGGYVVDAHDDHPYLNGTQYLSTIGTFEEWLGIVREMRSRDRGGYLFALTAEERVLLDPVHDDPYALLVAARDLEYALVPDTAWAHRNGAPDRIQFVRAPPAILSDLALVAEDGEPVVAFVPPAQLRQFGAERFANAPGGVLYVG